MITLFNQYWMKMSTAIWDIIVSIYADIRPVECMLGSRKCI